MVTHQNILGLVRNNHYADFSPGDTLGHISSLSFDAATFEIWGALLHGCRLGVIPKFDAVTPEAFARDLERLDVSILFLTTALFHQYAR
jgi:non-ribosomal peptide synthetase component F